MSVTVAATGHYETFASVVNDFGLALFDKIFDAVFVADVNKFSVLNRKSIYNFVAFRSKNFAANNEVCTGFLCGKNFKGKRH